MDARGKDVTAMLPYLSAYMGHAQLSDTYYYIHLVPGLFEKWQDLIIQRQTISCRRWSTMNDFFHAVRNFLLEYLPNQRCFSENTVRSYRQALNLFILYLRTEQKLTIKQIRFDTLNREMILNFLDWLETDRHCGTVLAIKGLWCCVPFSITLECLTVHRLR